ncbi:MAG: flavodoxin family protein [Nitrospirae bacterium]|nr:flavodoxin family protein [Nitrospirota bacterium]
MKIAAFLGSPRRGGNSEILLNYAASVISESGHDIQIFRPNSINVSPCLNCGGCEKSGICVIKDDMVQIYSAIRESDRFIISSPIFFFGLPAQIKAVIDRCQAFWSEKYLLKRTIPEGENGRKGLLILVGGMDKLVGFDCGDATAKAFFRTISVPKHETISFMKVDDRGAIKERPEAFLKVKNAVLNLL